MRHRVAVMGLAWLGVAAAGWGFLLPWAHLEMADSTRTAAEVLAGVAQQVGRVTISVRQGDRTVSGDLSSLADVPHQVRGVEIPRVVRQRHAQLALAVLEMLTQASRHLEAKSYAVYLVPGIALCCGVLLTAWGARAPVAFGVALACAVIAGVGCWKLLTVRPETASLVLRVGQGLWLSVWAYVGLAVAGAWSGMASRSRGT